MAVCRGGNAPTRQFLWGENAPPCPSASTAYAEHKVLGVHADVKPLHVRFTTVAHEHLHAGWLRSRKSCNKDESEMLVQSWRSLYLNVKMKHNLGMGVEAAVKLVLVYTSLCSIILGEIGASKQKELCGKK